MKDNKYKVINIQGSKGKHFPQPCVRITSKFEKFSLSFP